MRTDRKERHQNEYITVYTFWSLHEQQRSSNMTPPAIIKQGLSNKLGCTTMVCNQIYYTIFWNLILLVQTQNEAVWDIQNFQIPYYATGHSI